MAVTISGSGPVTGLTTINSITVPTSTFGKILQVVQGTTSTAVPTTSASYVDTNLTVSITPTSATSKILVLTAQSFGYDGVGSTTIDWQILRGATAIATYAKYLFSSGVQVLDGMYVGTFLDSPATTSATTYKTQFKRAAGTNTIYAQNGSTTSTITLMEVAA